MQSLTYIRLAQEYENKKEAYEGARVKAAIVTNFTDDILKKLYTGLCVENGIFPSVYQSGYKQYVFELKNPQSGLMQFDADITFILFDINPYNVSEFASDDHHRTDVLNDVRSYCKQKKGIVVLNTLASPASRQHGRLFKESDLEKCAREYNETIKNISQEHNNVYIIDTDHIMRIVGERNARDMRSLYAFSQPFTSDFMLEVAREWRAFTRVLAGKNRKCIVVDLDNVMWGGVVGELGPLGISLGPDYPGNAFQHFQRVLLNYYNQGIILAINSRNNPGDVDEVFEKNPHMILKKSHFAAIYANWNTKAENLVSIARDLNIGLDSLVFFDDEPMNRDLVRTQLPDVMVPDFSLPPEEYAAALLNSDAFHVLKVTDEDRERNAMYAAERERKTVQSSTVSLEDYLKALGIEIIISHNSQTAVPRLAQLTQKTNQFNLTTHRSTEQEISDWMNMGGMVYSAEVKDKFGTYGVTVLAVILPQQENTAELKIFLMSCRVMGRRVEDAFLRFVARDLHGRGFTKLRASFIPTKKNMPVAEFLPGLGAKEVSREGESVFYDLDLVSFIHSTNKEALPIKVTLLS